MTQTIKAKDSRSFEIKKILKRWRPQSFFSVRIHKYSMGESIRVKTNLLKQTTAEGYHESCRLNRQEELSDEQYKVAAAYRKAVVHNHKVEEGVRGLLRDYESVDLDPVTGEILAGGNTYLFVERI